MSLFIHSGNINWAVICASTTQGPRDATDSKTEKVPGLRDAICWKGGTWHRDKEQGSPAVNGTESAETREDLFEKADLTPAGQEGNNKPALQALGESVTGRRHGVVRC